MSSVNSSFLTDTFYIHTKETELSQKTPLVHAMHSNTFSILKKKEQQQKKPQSKNNQPN